MYIKGKVAQPPNFDKEISYFQDLDTDELLEESPSPKKVAWVMGSEADNIQIPPLCTRLEKWLHARKQHAIVSPGLSTILRTPEEPPQPIPFNYEGFDSSCLRKPGEFSPHNVSGSLSVQDMYTGSEKTHMHSDRLEDKDFDDIESEIKKLSLASRPSSIATDAFLALLKECEQPAPLTLLDVFSNLWLVLMVMLVTSFYVLKVAKLCGKTISKSRQWTNGIILF